MSLTYMAQIFMTLIILFFFFVLKTVLLWKRKSNQSRPKLPPGPPEIPLIGHLHVFNGELPHVIFRKLSHRYGPLIHVRLGQIHTIVASSVEMATEILKTQDKNFCGRPYFASTDCFSYGGRDLAFTPYNEHWRRIRRFVNAEFFSPARVQGFKAIREEEIKILLKTISKASAKGAPFNVSTMFLCFFNNLVYRLVFGKRISAEPGDCGKTQHHDMIMRAVSFTTALCVEDFYPCLAWVDRISGWRSRLEKTFRDMDGVFELEIEERIKMRGGLKEKGDFCLLDVLLRCEEELDPSLGFLPSREVIKAVLMDMFLAGTDAPSILMEWALTELIQNPKTLNKVQNEIRGQIQNKEKLVQESDLQNLPYLHKVFKENLRLHPPGPLLLPRECNKDTTINGFHIPAKARVFVNAWALARDPKIWGQDAEFFRPERFEKKDLDFDFKGNFMGFIPFGAGRRICPGMMFGVGAVELALANVLCGFEWGLGKGEEMDMREGSRMVSHKKVPLTLVARDVCV